MRIVFLGKSDCNSVSVNRHIELIGSLLLSLISHRIASFPKIVCRGAGTWITDVSPDYWYQSFRCMFIFVLDALNKGYVPSDRAFGLIGLSPPRGSHRGAPFGNASIIMFPARHRHHCGCAAVSESCSRSLPVSRQQRERRRYAELFIFQGTGRQSNQRR